MLFIVGSSILLQTISFNHIFAVKTPYKSGYDHGCSDAQVDTTDRYINEPLKGPYYHTFDFMKGYNAGFNSCSDSYNTSSSLPSTNSNIIPEKNQPNDNSIIGNNIKKALPLGCATGDNFLAGLIENDVGGVDC